MEMQLEEDEEEKQSSMVLSSGAKLVDDDDDDSLFPEDVVVFVNAGGPRLMMHQQIEIEGDCFFEGGTPITTHDTILSSSSSSSCPSSLYQSARLGNNFTYTFRDLPSSSSDFFFVDLHFAEIVNTNGPKAMRLFDVYLQDQKVASNIDIYALVGPNRPLQLRIPLPPTQRSQISLRFVQLNASPALVSAICISRKYKKPSLFRQTSPTPNQIQQLYENQIQQLTADCQIKTNECYEAWMSLTDANHQIEKLHMDLDSNKFQNLNLDISVREMNEKLHKLRQNYENDKTFWLASINSLEQMVKVLKAEQAQLSHDAHECANSVPELNKMLSAIQGLVSQCQDLKTRYNEEQAKRKLLYNQLQETKGNIRIFCRCRPLNREEISAGSRAVVDFDGAKNGELGLMVGSSSKKTFKFDRVYTPKDDQVAVFMDACPFVTSVLDGYNVCIFAYGQTGTGKTFTMEGNELNRGVNYRTLEELFKLAEERKETFSYEISVSVLEVYNEQIRDLLATTPSSKKLEVRQESEGVHHVPGIVVAKVENIKQVWDLLQAGSSARVVGSNNVNEHSSRSHCMLCIMVKAKNLMNGECTKSKLWLVDLAGSERLAKTDAQGERLKEAQNINRSLSALGDVISALATKTSHVPYRNSKLTHILQDSIGGDSKTLMFVQISPSENDSGETLSSLNFATRVRGIELGPAKKQIDTCELQKTKQMLEKSRQDHRIKDESLRKFEENYHYLESKFKGKDQLCRSLQDKVKELEKELQTKMDMQISSGRQQLLFSEKMKAKEESCIALEQKVKELENKLTERRHLDSTSLDKINELEYILKERKKSEAMLQEKVNELEAQLRLQQLDMQLMQAANMPGVAAHQQVDGKCGSTMMEDECRGESCSPILRSSNVYNRLNVGRTSELEKGVASLNQRKKIRELSSGALDIENYGLIPNSLSDRKASIGAKTKKIDHSKVYGRFMRTSKLTTTTTTMASRVNREQQQIGGVGGTSRTRGWH